MQPPAISGVVDGAMGDACSGHGALAIAAAPATLADSCRRRLRALGWELLLIVLAKIGVLSLIWWLAIHPHPRPDSSPAALDRLLAPASTIPPSQEAKS